VLQEKKEKSSPLSLLTQKKKLQINPPYHLYVPSPSYLLASHSPSYAAPLAYVKAPLPSIASFA
jgi:hypothetical protein